MRDVLQRIPWVSLVVVVCLFGVLLAGLGLADEGTQNRALYLPILGMFAFLLFAGFMALRSTVHPAAAGIGGGEKDNQFRPGGRGSLTAENTGGTRPRPRQQCHFADVAGLDEVLTDLQELVTYIRDRERFVAMDVRLPRGVLLYGPPGTGKTLIAKALASEADAAFLYASGSGFVEKYVGVGAQRIRELFTKARKQAPAIIFIDEIDSVGRSRGNGEQMEWDSTLNQLLTELDGFDTDENVLLVAATNRRELLDPALLRPGRLERQIYVGLPDLQARQRILEVHTRKKQLARGVDLQAIARKTPGLAGAHLAAMANEAALAATRAGRPEIVTADFDEALERVLAGLSSRTTVLAEDERRLVAHHEAGHAVAGWMLAQGVIERISIIPRSQALGYVLQIPEERVLQTRSRLLNRITVLLAGRAAEELITGEFTTGAADDLKKATEIAEKMVLDYGMGRRRPHQVIREQSLIFSRQVAREVNLIICECWEAAQTLVRERQDTLKRLAAALLERESLDRSEIENLLTSTHTAA